MKNVTQSQMHRAMKFVLEHGERVKAAEVWQRYVDGPRGWAICTSTLKAGRNEGHAAERELAFELNIVIVCASY